MIDLNRAVRWPLRPIGLDPGRALANAQPSPDERAAQRDELWRQVQRRFAPADAESEPKAKPRPV